MYKITLLKTLLFVFGLSMFFPITVYGAPILPEPELIFDPFDLDFGPVQLGESLDMNIRIMNNDGYLTISSIEIEEVVSPFSITFMSHSMPAILEGYGIGFIDLVITFTPTSLGRSTGTVAADIGTWVYTTTISGTGISVSEPPTLLILMPILVWLLGFAWHKSRPPSGC